MKKNMRRLSGRLAWILLLVDAGFRLIPCIAFVFYNHTIANLGALAFTGVLMLVGGILLFVLRLEKSDLVAGFLLLFSISLDITIYSPINPWALISTLSLLAIAIATSLKESIPSISARRR